MNVLFYFLGSLMGFCLLECSHPFIFTCLSFKIWLKIMCFLKAFAREKGKKKLRNMKYFWKLTSQLMWGILTYPTKMLAIMEKFIEE